MTIEQFLSLCQCPLCQSSLSISQDTLNAQCQNRHSFPIIDQRVPIFSINKNNADHTQNNEKTSQSFSMQWQMYKKGDNIWGWDKEKIRHIFLKNSGLTKEGISDKLILDLGCGHGMFSCAIAEMGANVVGFDISNGFLGTEKAMDQTLRNHINFVQGDIFNFPLKKEIVDATWCSGVLHHTPNTKAAFERVYKTVKKGGRFYIWLYKNVYYTPLLKCIRAITTKMPEKALVILCYIGAPFFALTKFLLTLLKLNYREFEKRTLRENALSIHDTLAPPYRWHHEKEEVIGWFKEAGFNNITVSEDSALGFGLYGDRG